ncbi:MAG: hypothetical protein WCL53_07905 [Chloroflexota bacterium]
MTQQQQTRLLVEFNNEQNEEACPVQFEGDPTVVLFFISWAYTLRLGGMHELAQAAMQMQRKHKVDLRPLLTYADLEVEDEDDQFALDHAWQDPAPLAASARAVTTAIDSDDEVLRDLLSGYDTLAPRLRELASMCDWAEANAHQVRLTFTLSQDGDPNAW